MTTLPTVQQLIARQIQVQDDLESGAITHGFGAGYIRNFHLIISGMLIAEQMAKEELTDKEKEVPIEPTFADSTLVDGKAVLHAMVDIYSQIETGKMNSVMGYSRIKALGVIAKTFRS